MTLPNKSGNKYKVRVAGVSPVEASEALFAHTRCLIGVSMSNPVFWRSSLNTLLAWAAEHFSEVLLVVGDHLHRHNERPDVATDAEAAALALQKGEAFLAHIGQYLPLYAPEQFRVQRWQAFTQSEAFKAQFARIQQFYAEEPDFRASIEQTIEQFAARHAQPTEALRACSRAYLLEELAVFSNLVGEGWQVVAYPGEQLAILLELSQGKYAHLHTPLREGVYVELHVSK